MGERNAIERTHLPKSIMFFRCCDALMIAIDTSKQRIQKMIPSLRFHRIIHSYRRCNRKGNRKKRTERHRKKHSNEQWKIHCFHVNVD